MPFLYALANDEQVATALIMKAVDYSGYALRYGVGQVREWLMLSGGPDLTRPRTIQAVVNERCNYHCRYCDFWRLPDYRDELSIAQWQQALFSLKQFTGRYLVQFAGGEPLLKKGFIELPRYCQEQGIDWGLITNGSEICEFLAEPLVNANPMNIDISVDSSRSEVHDYVRGKKGSLRQIEKSLHALTKAKIKTGRQFPIRIKPTVHRLNADHLDELVEWINLHQASSLDFSVIKPWTDEVENELWPETEAELYSLEQSIERLISLKHSGAPIENSENQLRAMPDYFRRKPVSEQHQPCRLGLRDFHMRPDGSVKSCGLYPPLGNVTDLSAEQIWRNDESREIRRQMTQCEKMGCSGCANLCLASQQSLPRQVQRGLLLLKQSRVV